MVLIDQPLSMNREALPEELRDLREMRIEVPDEELCLLGALVFGLPVFLLSVFASRFDDSLHAALFMMSMALIVTILLAGDLTASLNVTVTKLGSSLFELGLFEVICTDGAWDTPINAALLFEVSTVFPERSEGPG